MKWRYAVNIRAKQLVKWIGGLSIALWAGMLAGCDDSEFSHDPPTGQGTLVVDNWTGDRLQVYLDGRLDESVTANKHRYYDLRPGLYRVALEGDDTDRFWVDDVDVLEGRLTVMEVEDDLNDYDEFNVRVYLDD
jgi:hypothetical protein